MLQKILRKELPRHRHLTGRQAKWYIDTQAFLAYSGKAAEELMPWNRIRYKKIHSKISACEACKGSVEQKDAAREHYQTMVHA